MVNFDAKLIILFQKKKFKCRFSHKIAEFLVESGQKSGKFGIGTFGIVLGNLGRVLKKWVLGFDFKKPGYPGRVSGI